MILELRLSNFFSIKDEITIDFRAANLRSKHSRDLSDNIFNYKNTGVLKTLALYGANASGKSNIIKAIRFCVAMVINSHNHNENTIFNFIPFKFDGYSEKPSKFFINFVSHNIEYEYSFELTRTEIIKEALYFYPKGRITKIFERDETKGNTKNEKYSFGKFIKKPMDVAESTSAKTLFISRASQMDREIGKEIFNFFNNKFIMNLLPPDDVRIENNFNKYKAEFLEVLKIADSDIEEIEIEKKMVPGFRVDFKKEFDKPLS
ncbi:MAG: ATP-binding protein, partial [Bacteroidetes bacterium]